MHTRAYELREGVDPELFGGSTTLPDGSTYDVAAALAGSDGLIVTDDPKLTAALDSYPALKRAAVPDAEKGYDGMLKDELVALASEKGVDVADGALKDQIIGALIAHDNGETL